MTLVGGTRSILALVLRLFVGLTVVGGLLTLAATPASAVSCPYDTINRTLSVSPTSQDADLTFRANGPYLEVSNVFCALLSDVDTVNVNVASRPNIYINFDQQNGPLGPGHVIESDGASDIEFTIAGMTSTSTVRVYGTAGNDVIRVGQYFNKFGGTVTGQINMNAAQETSADVDVSYTAFPGRVELLGLDGNDTLSGTGVGTGFTGVSGTPLTLTGGLGSNTLAGGNATDTLQFREEAVNDGPDVMTGGAGIDLVAAQTQNGATNGSITLDGVANDGSHCPGTECNGDSVGSDIENVNGSSSYETIVGNGASQELSGGGGVDVINGAGGADRVLCQSGTAQGGRGNDTVQVFPPCRVVQGGKGTDVANFLSMGPTAVSVSLDNVANDGGSGFVMNVRADVENIVGTHNSDLIIGSDLANVIDAYEGDDTVYGLGGNDTVTPGPGVDTISGGPDRDRLSYETSTIGVLVNALTKTATGQGNDTFGSMEDFTGSPQADSLIGSDGANVIDGGAGNDGIQGRGGADTLQGGDGDDTIDGGDGSDICDQGLGVGSVVNCEA
jgi:Ca2+-binding RTX toxin-like protein